MTGFIAGMPFMGDIDEKIQLNRLETPRLKVPKRVCWYHRAVF